MQATVLCGRHMDQLQLEYHYHHAVLLDHALLRATNLTAMMLPEVLVQSIDGLPAYPEIPELEEIASGGGKQWKKDKAAAEAQEELRRKTQAAFNTLLQVNLNKFL